MNKTDARIIKSKAFLREGLITLLNEYPLTKVTIKKLCDTAEINRATFYSHYDCIEDLFNEMIDEFMDSIYYAVEQLNVSTAKQQRIELFEEFIKYIDNNSRLFSLIFEHSNNVQMMNNKYLSFKNIIQKKIVQNNENNNISTYISNFYIYAGGGILHTWIENGKKESYSTIAKILVNLLTHGTCYFFEN